MAQAFFQRLLNYYTQVGRVLRDEASASSIFPNATDVGFSRERIYADVLRQHLPKSCTVDFGGFLFNVEGEESHQIDIIVSNDIAPRFDLQNKDSKGKTFACVDGTVAVASIKSKLDSRELEDALLNISSIPEQQPLGQRFHGPGHLFPEYYQDWPYKIIFAPRGIGARSLYETLVGFYETHPDIPLTRRPQMIHVAGQYSFERTHSVRLRRDGKEIPPYVYNCVHDASDFVALFSTIAHVQGIAFASRFVNFSIGEMLNHLNISFPEADDDFDPLSDRSDGKV